MPAIRVRVCVPFRDYMRLVFARTYARPMLLVIVSVGVLIGAWVIGQPLGLSFLPKPQVYQFITLALIFVAQPVAVYSIIRRTYVSSDHLRETVEMQFDTERIRITGETFYTEFMWKKLFQVVELPGWFIIYKNTISAVLVPKSALSPVEVNTLRSLVAQVPGLRVKHLREP